MTHARGDGVLAVDKPEGPTSHDVVARARRALGTRRIGHTGTLDPFASGLLLLCVGRATRIAEYLSELPKTYRAVARLGEATDTLDRTGVLVSRSDAWRGLDRAAVAAALEAQTGERLQVAPAYSAKKVAGERLYRLARRGQVTEVKPSPVTIHRIHLEHVELPDLSFEVECSSGTYIRAIARDLGEALGTGAHLIELRRTKVGSHDVSTAVPLDSLEEPAVVERAWMNPLRALGHLPQAVVDAKDAAAISHGREVPAPVGFAPGSTLVVGYDGALLAVASIQDGALRPKKVFASA